jgi:hypothetical protein
MRASLKGPTVVVFEVIDSPVGEFLSVNLFVAPGAGVLGTTAFDAISTIG